MRERGRSQASGSPELDGVGVRVAASPAACVGEAPLRPDSDSRRGAAAGLRFSRMRTNGATCGLRRTSSRTNAGIELRVAQELTHLARELGDQARSTRDRLVDDGAAVESPFVDHLLTKLTRDALHMR